RGRAGPRAPRRVDEHGHQPRQPGRPLPRGRGGPRAEAAADRAGPRVPAPAGAGRSRRACGDRRPLTPAFRRPGGRADMDPLEPLRRVVGDVTDPQFVARGIETLIWLEII